MCVAHVRRPTVLHVRRPSMLFASFQWFGGGITCRVQIITEKLGDFYRCDSANLWKFRYPELYSVELAIRTCDAKRADVAQPSLAICVWMVCSSLHLEIGTQYVFYPRGGDHHEVLSVGTETRPTLTTYCLFLCGF